MLNNCTLAELSACLLEEPTWQNPKPMTQAADALLNDEFLVHAVNFGNTNPLANEKQLQSGRMSTDEAKPCFTNGASPEIICGKISGNLECRDFVDPTTDETRFPVSLFTKEGGILTKKINCTGGQIKKDASLCFLSSGKVETCNLTLAKFPAFLREIKTNQAIAHGICESGTSRVVSGKNFNGQPGTITRSLENFKYPKGPGLGLLDIDLPNGATLTVQKIIDMVTGIFPEFAKTGFVSTPSTSSCIYTVDGEQLRGDGSGRHIYIIVKDASDLPRFGKVLFERAWLAGHGSITVSKSGSKLVRTFFDAAVFSPERLIFEAGAVCAEGLEQRLPFPKYHPGKVLDTNLLEDLNPTERTEYEKLVKTAEKASAPESDAARNQYIEDAKADLIAGGIDEEKARQIVNARLRGNLYWGDSIYFDSLGRTAVAAILDDPDKYDGQTCRDPLEYDYGPAKARFYANSDTGKPCINSFAHGGRLFWLKYPPVVLDPADPLPGARKFVEAEYTTSDGSPFLLYWQGQHYEWAGPCFAPRNRDDIKTRVYSFLDNAETHSGAAYKPDKNKVETLCDALKAATHIQDSHNPPCWLKDAGMPPPCKLIAVNNGLLHWPTKQLIPQSPHFFNLNATSVDYSEDAVQPASWHRFLCNLWGDDPETIDTLQEFFGYSLTLDTTQQKIFLIYGPKRSGKGTIARILTELLGKANVASPTLSSLSKNFGLQCLIGKQLAIISDARLSSKVDQTAIAERLLSISGEDSLSIPRKYLGDFTAKLNARFLVLSNELPRIGDAAGALASRFIILRMTESFFGKEDPGLTNKLMKELPGILRWSLTGLDRLHKRGHFIQPASAAEAVQELADLASPVSAFAQDCCNFEQSHTVPCSELYQAYNKWCDLHGRNYPGTRETFGKDLKAAFPRITTSQSSGSGERHRVYNGIKLLPNKQWNV